MAYYIDYDADTKQIFGFLIDDTKKKGTTIEVTEAQWEEAQASNTIDPDALTFSTVDYRTEEELTAAEHATFRKTRDPLLKEADYLINTALDNGEDTTKLREYRQALRDATKTWVMPSLSDYTNTTETEG